MQKYLQKPKHSYSDIHPITNTKKHKIIKIVVQSLITCSTLLANQTKIIVLFVYYKGHNTTNHSDHHEQDNCDGCQKQRKENNMLVDFYQRLTNIETKVDKIKDSLTNQQQSTHSHRQQLSRMASVLLQKPDKAIEQIKQHNSKEMGYQLASALIQRQIKTRIENQRLQTIIDQLLIDKKKLQELRQKPQQIDPAKNQSRIQSKSQKKKDIFQQASPSRYTDVLDDVRKTNSIQSTYFAGKKKQKQMSNSYFADGDNKQYWQTTEAHVDTSFSNFTVNKKEKSRSDQPAQYAGLNLWLYQFKTQQIDQNPIKSLRKPVKLNDKPRQAKYKYKF